MPGDTARKRGNSTNHQSLNELNEVSLSRATTEMGSVGSTGGPRLGNTVLEYLGLQAEAKARYFTFICASGK